MVLVLGLEAAWYEALEGKVDEVWECEEGGGSGLRLEGPALVGEVWVDISVDGLELDKALDVALYESDGAQLDE